MKCDDPLPKYYEKDRNTLEKVILGILSHYHDRSNESTAKVTETFIAEVDMLYNQFLDIDDPELRLSENEIKEILHNLPSDVINTPFSLNSIVKILEEQDKIHEKMFYHNLISENPTTPWEHVNVGNAKWALGLKEDALRHYSEAITKNPDFLVAYVARASCLESCSRIEEALQDIKRVYEYKSNDIGDFYDLVESAETAYRAGKHIYTVNFIIRTIELILNNFNRAHKYRNLILIQTGSVKHYIYFKTIGKLIWA